MTAGSAITGWLCVMRILLLATGVGAAVAVDAQTQGSADTRDTAAAVAAATTEGNKWLAALDAGRYAETWADAATVFKEGAAQGDWIAQLTNIHETLGKAVIRKLESADYSRTLRGAPTGDYVTIIYLTQFERAQIALETLALTKEPDGHWRVAGYNIGRAPDSK